MLICLARFESDIHCEERNLWKSGTLVQVLGRQVALGEDEEAPEDPGAVGE